MKRVLFFVLSLALIVACSKEEVVDYENDLALDISIDNSLIEVEEHAWLTLSLDNKTKRPMMFDASFKLSFTDLVENKVSISDFHIDDADPEKDLNFVTRINLEPGQQTTQQVDITYLNALKHCKSGHYNLKVEMDIHDSKSPKIFSVHSNPLIVSINDQ